MTAIALSLWAVASTEPGGDIQTEADRIAFDVFEAPFDSGPVIGGLLTASAGRPVYRYSVVPGGTYTGTELRTAIGTDPVVAAHYKDLDQSQLRVETVARDRYVHVSYRKGDQVFWTKNKVLLRQGETIITDGRTQVRARCGNCISEQPLLPTTDEEPDAVEFDRLVAPIAASPAGAPQVALVTPTSPLAFVPPAAAPAGGATSPLAAGRFGGGVSPLAAGTRDAGLNDPEVPGPPVDPPGPDNPPSPPGNPPPGGDLPPPRFPDPPPGDEPPPLVPPEDFPSLELPPPDLPPPYVPPGDPVPVPEAGTLLLVAGGAALLMRRLRSRSR